MSETLEPITYGVGLDNGEREPAAVLYSQAFGQKLGPILGEHYEALLARTFHLDRALVARRGSKIVGLAGFDHDGKSLVGFKWPDVRRTYGWFGGGFRYLSLALFDRTPAPDELLMDGIVVDSGARGQGIGSELLQRVVAMARNLELKQVRLDVVDTNPGARRLYERQGFVAVKTEEVPWLRRWFGFGASTTMIKELESEPAD